MRTLLCSLLATLLLSTAVNAQTRTIAERLGHPRDAKLLILHADDLGVAHSENAASFAALDSGGVNSASIMMTTPWVTETATYMREKPNADLGLHLVMTSEWDTYRWGGVAPNDKTQSLHDPDGTMPRQVRTVATRAKIDEVERELRAQIDRAYAIGLKPTHVDSHMGALFSTPELFATYVKVARSYKLPFLAFIGAMHPASRAALQPGDIFPDTVFDAGDTPKDQWKQFYLDALKNLKPGLTEILFHLGYDDAELKAVTVNKDAYGSGWRQRDFDVVMSREWKQALKDNKVVLVTWREIQKAMYGPQ
jgi:chitin disaccharide deacetylase